MNEFDEVSSIAGGRRRRGVPRKAHMNTDEIPVQERREPHPSTYYRRPRPQDTVRETITEMRTRHLAMMQLMLMWLAVIIGALIMLGGAVRVVMWAMS